MTHKEKEIVKWCIENLMWNGGDYAGAIAKLCRLVGMVYPAGELIDLKRVPLSEIPNKNMKFKPNKP